MAVTCWRISWWQMAVVVACAGANAVAQPALTVTTPAAQRSLVSASGASIAGTFDPRVATAVELIEPLSVKKSVPTGSKEQKEDFPTEVRRLFPDNLLLERIELCMSRAGLPNDTVAYLFRLEENVDLRKFWGSREFREILGRVYEKKTLAAEVVLSGGGRRSRNVAAKEYQAKWQGRFAFSVALAPGVNVFRLRAVGGNGTILALDTISFFYKTQVQADNPPAEFVHTPFHTDSLESQCGGCHTLALDAATKESKPAVEDQCKACHEVLVNQTSVHPPAATWDCLMCHDPASSPKYQLYKDKTYDATLCYQCHDDKQKEIASKPVVHPPAASGDCLICHDPHGTRNESLVVDWVPNVCSSCHDDMAKMPHPVPKHPRWGRPNPLKPDKELTCVACHNPHASDNEKLLMAPRMQLCQQCHKK